MDEIDEGLDEVFLLDENSYEQNYQNELKKQIEMSVDKYKEAGEDYGLKLGTEIGYYQEILNILKDREEIRNSEYCDYISKMIISIQNLLNPIFSFEYNDPEYENKLLLIRTKFSLVCQKINRPDLIYHQQEENIEDDFM